MVAHHHAHFAVELARAVPQEQVVQAVAFTGNEDRHARASTVEVQAESRSVERLNQLRERMLDAERIEDIPRLQTRDYTKRVIGSYAAYQWLTGSAAFDDRVLGSPKSN